MSRLNASLIGALAASSLLLAGGVAFAGAGSELGSGYTAADAPLGSPTELRIDLHGRVAARCDMTTPPAQLSALDVGRNGQAQTGFAIDCNAPFVLRVRSENGALASEDLYPGVAQATPYELSVDLDTDGGRRALGWCDAADLTDGAAGACPFAAGNATRGWSSNDDTAIDRNGRIHLRWRGWRDDRAAPVTRGRYGDVITIELEVRS